MDCPSTNFGCKTGAVESSIGYLETHLIETAADYPYTAQTGNCAYNSSMGVVNSYGSMQIQTQSPLDLQAAVDGGPVAAVLNAGSDVF